MFFSRFHVFALGFLGHASSGTDFTNPIKSPGGADPQVTYSGGWYYFIATEWDDLKHACARSIQDLKTAEAQTNYTDSNRSRCCKVWGHELHYLDGK
jgi:GH43 family beta-xylosidase